MADQRPILCVDFDGVVHSYKSGWQGATVIPDPPVPGALDFLRIAVRNFHVAVYSSRSHQSGGRKAMRDWLIHEAFKAGVGTDWIDLIEWPDHKPSAMVTLDDRAITFTGEFPTMAALMRFRPWNKKEAE